MKPKKQKINRKKLSDAELTRARSTDRMMVTGCHVDAVVMLTIVTTTYGTILRGTDIAVGGSRLKYLQNFGWKL